MLKASSALMAEHEAETGEGVCKESDFDGLKGARWMVEGAVEGGEVVVRGRRTGGDSF